MTRMRQMVLTLLPKIRGTAQRSLAQPHAESQPILKAALMTSRPPAAFKPKPRRGDYASNM